MTTHVEIPPPHRARAKWSVSVLIVVWLTAVAAGFWGIARFDFFVNEPSSHGVVEQWPADSAVVQSKDRPTLLLFLHPKCPCSQASVNELERLFASLEDTENLVPDLIVVATVPPNADSTWSDTDTVARVRQIENAQVFVDRGGREAARFGAVTSGHVMLFDTFGKRQYTGGITWARGQVGANVGRDMLTEVLREDVGQLDAIPSFGCRLCLPDSDARGETAKQPHQVGTQTSASI